MYHATDFVVLDPKLVLFGDRLRLARASMGLNQKEFGEICGTSGNSQLAYEGGKTPPPITYLYRLGEHGIDIGYLLTGQKLHSALTDEQSLLIEMFGRLSTQAQQAIMTIMVEIGGPDIAHAYWQHVKDKLQDTLKNI